MSFDLSWLWDTLNAIVSTIQSWFGSLWQAIQNIVNAGQGIFAGLVSFGSFLWDAITKAFTSFGQWLYNAFQWIWQGLIGLGTEFGKWFSGACQWIASGLQWIANQLYGFGQWLYNGILWMLDSVRKALEGLWNWITATISGISNAISSWWANVTTQVNQWFTNLILTIRRKFIQTIMADIAIMGMWKAGERIMRPSNIKDIGLGLIGIFASPIVGYLIGNFIDSLLPRPSTQTYPLIPSITEFQYTPPLMGIERPPEPIAPSKPPAPPVYGYVPIYDLEMTLTRLTYGVNSMVGRDFSYQLPLTFDINSGEGYGQGLNILLTGLSYELEVR